jgi:hypothetical protein
LRDADSPTLNLSSESRRRRRRRNPMFEKVGDNKRNPKP